MICSCGEEYERIAQHWSFNPSHRTELSERQYDIIVGLLLGDGTVVDDADEKAFVVEMKNIEFIDWLDDELGWLSSGYSTKGEYGRLRTKSHPEITELRGWYWTGEKVFPSEINLNPIIFEMWYVSDGTLNMRDETRQPRMRLSSMQDSKVIENILSTIPFDLEYTWNISSSGFGGQSKAVVFSVETTKKLQNWMTEIPKGFEYKYVGVEIQ